MREQTFDIRLEPNTCYSLYALSHLGTLLYNAALKQRREHTDAHLNRTKQMKNIDCLYTLAGIDALPYSVAYQLLLELDVVTYTPARSQERTLDRFHALTWAGNDVEMDNYGILLQPNVHLPLPDFSDPSGILTRIRVRTIIKDVAIVHFRWKPIPVHAGPGRDIGRAFGYERASGGVNEYATMLLRIGSRGLQ